LETGSEGRKKKREGLGKLEKKLFNSSGLEPTTFQLVA
jgi:hypothetical protein